MAEEQAPEFQAFPGRDVFISYASDDKAVADAVCQTLERAGVACWIAPRDVTPGDFYADSIVRALDAAQIIVLILSGHSAASPHVLREVERASARRHPVLSLRVDKAPLPPGLEYFLNTSQWLDASDGEARSALPKLLEAVQRQLSTPSAIAPTKAGDTAPAVPGIPPGLSVRSRPVRRLIRTTIVLGAVLAIGLAYVAATKMWPSKPPTNELPVAATPGTTPAAPVISEKSIAVLPFVDMSEKKDQEYFSDGLSEELIDMLARVPDLRVPARTSSFYFKGKQTTIADIAKALSVSHVLEGSVRKSGNRLRVTAQLIRVDNGYHIWSETFDRKLDDIFRVQDEIAGAVVKALKISLATNEPLRAVPTMNSEAYALLLQARYFMDRNTSDDLTQAILYYRRALQLDPHSAAAWAQLSEALNWSTPNVPPSSKVFQERRSQSLQAAERAIAIDPNLSEAHTAMREIRYWFDWDWAAADAENRQARALDPASSSALQGACVMTALRGHINDAARLCDDAKAGDPLNTGPYLYLEFLYLAMDRLSAAETAARKVVELAPTAAGVHGGLAIALLAQKKQQEALAELERESDTGTRLYGLARTYIVLGQKSKADTALAEFERSHAADAPAAIASLYSLRGERDQAFHWLDRAYELRDYSLIQIPAITINSDFENLRGDSRYKALLRKMNLPE